MTRFIIAALALAFLGGGAVAHSKKESTSPMDGADLVASPDTIAMTFDMPIMITLFRITDADGGEHAFDGGEMAPVTDYQVTPAPMSAGTYSVEWRGLSSDGHPVEGGFSFTVR